MKHVERPSLGIEPGPDYKRMAPRWDFARDCYEGADKIKRGPDAFKYLPPSPTEREDFAKNKRPEFRRYDFRRRIATYENFFKPTIDDVSGLMQKNAPLIAFGEADDAESPKEVRDILWRGNRYEDGLKGLKQRVNFHQVLLGRYGLLLDVATDAAGREPRFCIVEYPPEKILDGEVFQERPDLPRALKWVLLDESGREFDRATKRWEPKLKYRVIGIDRERRYYNAVLQGESAVAQWLAFDFDAPVGEGVVYPEFKERGLDFVPFTVVNVDRIGFEEFQEPPYFDVAEIALSCYVVDSWYKQAIYNHATPTLVLCNAARSKEQAKENEIRLGGVVWLTGQGASGASASILETSGAGLAEMRAAKNALKEALKYSSIRELLDGAGANSSGEAIQLRTAAGTAAPAAIDQAGAIAIEEQLYFAARWAGATFDEATRRIQFAAVTSYLGTEFQLPSVVSLLSTNAQTKTLSQENLYAVLQKAVPGVLTSFDDNEAQKALDFDKELDDAEAANRGAFGDAGNEVDAEREREDADENEENDVANENDDEDEKKSAKKRPKPKPTKNGGATND